MRKTMISVTYILASCFVICIIANHFTVLSFLNSLTITIGVTLYHFAMRLFVGFIIKKQNISFRADQWWFRDKKMEHRFYKAIRLDRLKNKMPTFNEEEFDIKNGIDSVIYSTCRAEIVHEVIIVFSFLPLLMNLYDDSSAYLITSVIAALFDSIFVMMQRYNRPRLLMVKKRMERKNNVKTKTI